MPNKQRMNQSSLYPTIARAKRRSRHRASGDRKTTRRYSRRVSQKVIARARATRSRVPIFSDFPGLSKDLWDMLQMLRIKKRRRGFVIVHVFR